MHNIGIIAEPMIQFSNRVAGKIHFSASFFNDRIMIAKKKTFLSCLCDRAEGEE
jgi:hypothetical protein